MNDKITPMAATPVSTPANETQTGPQTAPVKKAEEPKTEPATIPAAKSWRYSGAASCPHACGAHRAAYAW